MINKEAILDILGISILTALSLAVVIVISGGIILFCKFVKESLKSRNWH